MAMPGYNNRGFTILLQQVINEDLYVLKILRYVANYTSCVQRLSKLNGILQLECWTHCTSESPDTAVP